MIYFLEFKPSKGAPRRVQVKNSLSIGSDPSNDIRFPELCAVHTKFRLSNGVLSVVNLADSLQMTIGKTNLGRGRMYLVGKGDTIHIGESLKIVVRTTIDTGPLPTEDQGSSVQKKATVQAGTAIPLRRPGSLSRYYALIFEILIAAALYLSLVVPGTVALPTEALIALVPSVEEIASVLETLGMGILEPHLPAIYTMLFHPTAISIFLIFVLINVASSVLFSSSLGLAIMGAHTEGSFLTARLKAIVRFFLGLVTGPLGIFDLPALFAGPTLKEVLTASRLGYTGRFMQFTGALLLLPLLTLFILMLPVLTHYQSLTKTQYEIQDVQAPSEEANFTANLPLFGLKIRTTLGEHEHFLPYFESGGGTVRTGFTYLDLQKRASATLLFEESIDYIKDLDIKRFSSDPAFAIKFPHLHNLYGTAPKEKADHDARGYAEELSGLFRAVLSLDLTKLPEFLSTTSPVPSLYIGTKKAVLSRLSEGSNGGRITEMTNNGLTFFRYRHEVLGIDKLLKPWPFPRWMAVWNIRHKTGDEEIVGSLLRHFVAAADASDRAAPSDAFRQKLTSPNLMDFFFRPSVYGYDEEHFDKIIEFFRYKTRMSADEYYLEELTKSLSSFQKAYADSPPADSDLAEGVKKISDAIDGLFEPATSEEPTSP